MNIKMGKQVLKFGYIETEKQRIHINRVETNIIIISERFTCGKNGSVYFAAYKNNEKVTALSVLIPIMKEYVKNFDGAKTMFFFNAR